MSAKIIRGQSVGWPMAFWNDDAETIPKNCMGAALSVTQNTTGVAVQAVWTDQAQGKARLVITALETAKMKSGRYGTFRVKIAFAADDVVVYPNVDLLVE